MSSQKRASSRSGLRSAKRSGGAASRARQERPGDPGTVPRPAARPSPALGWLGALCAAAAAALVLVSVPREVPAPGIPAVSPEVLAKDDTLALRAYRKMGDGQELLASGQAAAEHDVIQLAYRTPAELFGVIVSIDGRGVVTHHLPEAPGPAVALETGRDVPLPHAYELDDAPLHQRFYLVAFERSFDSMTIARAAQAAHARGVKVLDLTPDFRQTSFDLQEEVATP